VKVGVVVFPGSNCDRDMYHVLTDVFNLDAQYYWHEKSLPKNIDAVILPGGFSYGELRKRLLRIVLVIGIITAFILTFHAEPIQVGQITLYYPLPEPLNNIAANY